MLQSIKKDFEKLSDKKKAVILSRFFKTGKGEYGDGDIFLGIVVPKQRELVKKYCEMELDDVEKLLSSKIHEYRLTAVLILVEKYKKEKDSRKKIFDLYLKNTKNINNWDLVDLSAPNIVGNYLLDKDRRIIYKLAKSNHLWEKRIAILSTLAFIRKNEFDDTLKIAEILLNDKHDLMHKAVGWMLREVGKRNQKVEEEFLNKFYRKMPRTMLRYSIEKFDSKKKEFYMKK